MKPNIAEVNRNLEKKWNKKVGKLKGKKREWRTENDDDEVKNKKRLKFCCLILKLKNEGGNFSRKNFVQNVENFVQPWVLA